MNYTPREVMTLVLHRLLPRRDLISGMAAGVALRAAGPCPLDAAAKRKERKPQQRNEFGCVPVGRACQGKDEVCCSGICNGKKPRKGKKDTSRCVAHDSADCTASQRSGICGGTDVPCTTSQGGVGLCQTTTGNAAYCALASVTVCPAFSSCRTDADCQAFMLNPNAACVRCDLCSAINGPTACVIP
jgi:hypothetical protein